MYLTVALADQVTHQHQVRANVQFVKNFSRNQIQTQDFAEEHNVEMQTNKRCTRSSFTYGLHEKFVDLQ